MIGHSSSRCIIFHSWSYCTEFLICRQALTMHNKHHISHQKNLNKSLITCPFLQWLCIMFPCQNAIHLIILWKLLIVPLLVKNSFYPVHLYIKIHFKNLMYSMKWHPLPLFNILIKLKIHSDGPWRHANLKLSSYKFCIIIARIPSR